jgi:hypothetical protein
VSIYIELIDMFKSIYQSLKSRAELFSPAAVYWSRDMKQALAYYSDGFWAILDKESETVACFLDFFPGGKSGFALGAAHEQIANVNMRSILETGGLVMNSDGSFWPSQLPDWVVIKDSEVQPGLDKFSKRGGFFGEVDFSELTASGFTNLINSRHLPYLEVRFNREFSSDMRFGVHSDTVGMFDTRSYNDYPIHIKVINKIFQLFDPKCLEFDKLINSGILNEFIRDNEFFSFGLVIDANVRDFCKHATQKTFASIAKLPQLDKEVIWTEEENHHHDKKLPSLRLSFNNGGFTYELYDPGYDNQIVDWSYADPDNVSVTKGGVEQQVGREVWCNENIKKHYENLKKKYYGKPPSHLSTYEDCITENISDILLVCDFLMARHLLAPDEFKAKVNLTAYDGRLKSFKDGPIVIYYRFDLEAVVQHESGVETAVVMQGNTFGETNIEITIQLPPTSCIPGNPDYENLQAWYKRNRSVLIKSGFELSSGLPDEIPFFRGKLQADYGNSLNKTSHHPRKNGKSGNQAGDY